MHSITTMRTVPRCNAASKGSFCLSALGHCGSIVSAGPPPSSDALTVVTGMATVDGSATVRRVAFAPSPSVHTSMTARVAVPTSETPPSTNAPHSGGVTSCPQPVVAQPVRGSATDGFTVQTTPATTEVAATVVVDAAISPIARRRTEARRMHRVVTLRLCGMEDALVEEATPASPAQRSKTTPVATTIHKTVRHQSRTGSGVASRNLSVDFERPTRHLWTEAESQLLAERVTSVGEPIRWRDVAFGKRSAKQCRERWMNKDRPDLLHTPWTEQEDTLLVDLCRMHGTKWSTIASRMLGRTCEMVKKRANTTKLIEMRSMLPAIPLLVGGADDTAHDLFGEVHAGDGFWDEYLPPDADPFLLMREAMSFEGLLF
jgi:hypothetical protein